MRSFIALVGLCLLSLNAQARQNVQVVNKAVDDFMQVQIKGLPGVASYSVGTISNSERLTACQNLQVGLPRGGRLWGKTHIVVRCEDSPGWSLYVPVKVKVVGPYLVAGRALRQGQLVDAADIAVQQGDLTELPGGTLTDMQQATGRTLVGSVAAGQPVRSDLLRQALIVRQGQTVKIVSKGHGFEVASEGEALNNASPGQVVRVRLASGRLISGVAEGEGTVAVAY